MLGLEPGPRAQSSPKAPLRILRLARRPLDLRAERLRLRALATKSARRAELAKLRARALATLKLHEAAITASGATVVRRFPLSGCYLLRASDEAAAKLRANALFSELGDSRSFHPAGRSSTLRRQGNPVAPWNGLAYHKTPLTRANGSLATFPLHGAGVTIAFFDTGLDMDETGGTGAPVPHECFLSASGATRLLDSVKVGLVDVNDVPGAISPMNKLGHGTAVASVALGKELELPQGVLLVPEGQAPEAMALGYGIANASNGITDSPTYILAIQMLREYLLVYTENPVRVLNISYAGWPDPLDPVETELDWLADEFDLLCVTSAMNQGDWTGDAHGARNGLSVGAVSRKAEWRTTTGGTLYTAGNDFDPMRSTFSTGPYPRSKAGTARGPLLLDPDRRYPDLSAIGADHVFKDLTEQLQPPDAKRNDLAMAQADWKQAPTPPGTVYKAAGTSMAAPQVSGAAALYFAERPTATALEVRAALLASTETADLPNEVKATDDGKPNLFHGYRNTYGTGFLRVDYLGDLCQRVASARALVTTTTLSPGAGSVTLPYAGFAGAASGDVFTVVLAWNRLSGELALADVDLKVTLKGPTSGDETILEARSRSESYEKLSFALPAGTSSIDIAIVPVGLPPQPLPVQVVVRALPQHAKRRHTVAGRVEYTPQPASCTGTTMNDQSVAVLLPQGYEQAYGSGGWEKDFVAPYTGGLTSIVEEPRLVPLEKIGLRDSKWGVVEMWFSRAAVPSSLDNREIRGIALRCWRGGPNSKRHPMNGSRFDLPQLKVDLGYTTSFAQGAAAHPSAEWRSYSPTTVPVTVQGITVKLPGGGTRQVGAPMIVPRRWDDWTIFLSFPPQARTGFGDYFNVVNSGFSQGTTSYGLYMRFEVVQTGGVGAPSLPGLDWVRDDVQSPGVPAYRMRVTPTGPSWARYVFNGEASLVLGMIVDRPVTQPPRLEIAGEPYVGGSFSLIVSHFQAASSPPRNVLLSWASTLMPPSGPSCTWMLPPGTPVYASLAVDGRVPHGTEYTVPAGPSMLYQVLHFQAQQTISGVTQFSNAATVRIGGR